MSVSRVPADHIRAEVITQLAIRPEGATIADLAREIGETVRADVSRSATMFTEMGWLARPTLYTRGARNLILTTTPQFWEDFKYLVGRVGTELPSTDRHLYGEAVAQCKAAEDFKHIPDGFASSIARANFLGRAMVLSERHDLGGRHGWMAGFPGWKSLVTIVALKQPQPALAATQ